MISLGVWSICAWNKKRILPMMVIVQNEICLLQLAISFKPSPSLLWIPIITESNAGDRQLCGEVPLVLYSLPDSPSLTHVGIYTRFVFHSKVTLFPLPLYSCYFALHPLFWYRSTSCVLTLCVIYLFSIHLLSTTFELKSIPFLLKILFFNSAITCIWHMGQHVSVLGSQKRNWMPWGWSCWKFWKARPCVLGSKLGSSGRTIYTLNCWAVISPQRNLI